MNQRAMIAAAAASLLSLVLVAAPAQAADEQVKCFGIAKAGQNVCASHSGVYSCTGQSKVDMDRGEWKYVAKGTCKALKGMAVPEVRELRAESALGGFCSQLLDVLVL